MRFNLISNLTNGCGLQRDYELLRKALEARGHTVYGVQFNQKPPLANRVDINIFLEVVNPLVFSAAAKQWVVPNPEWWFAKWNVYPWDLVLAKTRDCERIFRAKVGSRCQYLGWTARDLYLPGVLRQPRFLHVCGKSRFKNTPAVIAGCKQARVPLTVIGAPHRVSDAELTFLMNSHFCHIMPSAYEGYGQALHEAMSAGQVIITTDEPPMNEIQPAVLVPSIQRRTHHSGVLHRVSSYDLAQAVRRVSRWTPEHIQNYHDQIRAKFLQEQQAFEKALDDLVGGRT